MFLHRHQDTLAFKNKSLNPEGGFYFYIFSKVRFNNRTKQKQIHLRKYTEMDGTNHRLGWFKVLFSLCGEI